MTRVATVRKADLDRVFRAIRDDGQRVARVEVRPGGIVEIIAGLTSAAPNALSDDDVNPWGESISAVQIKIRSAHQGSPRPR